VIALAVRWYTRYRLSYADVAEWLAERGFAVARSAVSRWVQRFLPLFGAAARRHRRPVGRKWLVDETSCAFKGGHADIYRAVDQDGQVVDASFSERRNGAAAQAFFERALRATATTPERVTTDKAKCYPPALRAVLPGVEHRRSKYLNNGLEMVWLQDTAGEVPVPCTWRLNCCQVGRGAPENTPAHVKSIRTRFQVSPAASCDHAIERNHSHLKQRLYPMRGFKRGASADTLARGHALVRNLRGGYSDLTTEVPPNLRLSTAWAVLIQSI
jgi:transposase-like protein